MSRIENSSVSVKLEIWLWRIASLHMHSNSAGAGASFAVASCDAIPAECHRPINEKNYIKSWLSKKNIPIEEDEQLLAACWPQHFSAWMQAQLQFHGQYQLQYLPLCPNIAAHTLWIDARAPKTTNILKTCSDSISLFCIIFCIK